MSQSGYEIERKFLLREKPEDLESHTQYKIRQGYLSLEGEREIRLRTKQDQYFLTIKEGNGLQRKETEISINAEQFSSLWPYTEGQRLEKTRYLYPLDKQAKTTTTIEIDVYHGALAPLMIAEIEFSSIEASHLFNPPSFLGKEVTEIATYKNARLAIKKAIPA